MKKTIAILLSGWCLWYAAAAEKIFEWGHDGLNAKILEKTQKPKSAINIKLEEGGIRLSRDSQIRFDVSGLPLLNEYTLVFRGKIKFDVRSFPDECRPEIEKLFGGRLPERRQEGIDLTGRSGGESRQNIFKPVVEAVVIRLAICRKRIADSKMT